MDRDSPVTTSPHTRPRGRPRGYDSSDAIDAATRCFWSLGHDRASISVLCDAMGISRASLYADFGDKDALFLSAIGHYSRTYSAPALAALTGDGDAQGELQAFFDGMIQLVTGNPDTPGCLIVCVLSEAATANPRFQALLARKTDAMEARIAQTLRGAAPADDDKTLQAKAAMLAATARGLAINARAGIPASRLRRAADIAIRLACQPTPIPE